MTNRVLGLGPSAESAADMFATFREGKPNLLPLGIDEIDDNIGGMFPGTLVVVAMDTGVGKSRFMLDAALRFGEVCDRPGARAGIISVEDGEDVVGARLLAWASGVDSLRIRRKSFANGDIEKLRSGLEYLKHLDESGNAPVFAYRPAATLDDVLSAVDELAERGCQVIWLDYLQKIRGVSDDRRGEIGLVMAQFQRSCARSGAVPCMLSQFTRRGNLKQEPQLHHLKESGDIENEARLAILGYRNYDLDPDGEVITLKVAKSTFGGHVKFHRKTGASGMLEKYEPYGV